MKRRGGKGKERGEGKQGGGGAGNGAGQRWTTRPSYGINFDGLYESILGTYDNYRAFLDPPNCKDVSGVGLILQFASLVL